ncbi:DUF3099 domain-containing protein [Corynebacterium casei]|uniref:DUF3099 domain-containing protein n=1 Tax=Corynebacterium casei TaxID=160386 RepID=UPI003FCFD844
MSSGQNKGKGKSSAKPWWKRKESVLITDAEVSPGQDRHRREIGYGILMFLRVPSLLLTVWVIYAYNAWLLGAFISAITIPLPWIAVVFANARGQKRDPRERNTYKPALARQARAEALAAGNSPQLEYTDSPRRESDIIDHVDTDNPNSSKDK